MPAWNRLPDAVVNEILDRRVAGGTLRGIAREMGLPLSTVRSAVYHARIAGDPRAAVLDADAQRQRYLIVTAARYGGIVPPDQIKLYRKLRERCGFSRADALAAVSEYSAGVSSQRGPQVLPSVPSPAGELAAGASASAASFSGGGDAARR